ncbi:MAG: hypothetical protein FJX25_04655 [Alphaproteobacteria bacterium]|nr:hypothetical protein [Alphaproteobacteria bacterium]
MLTQIIPNHERELAWIGTLAPSGFVLGFGLHFGQPDVILNCLPDAWCRTYEIENYVVKDPVAYWIMSRSGATRWSEVRLPDPFGVMNHAARQGLRYGASFVAVVGHKRSFLSVARPDRELTDAEMAQIQTKLEIWAQLYPGSSSALSERERSALRAVSDGLSLAEAGESLEVSASTIKLRLASAQKKLGGRNTMHTVVRAIRNRLI